MKKTLIAVAMVGMGGLTACADYPPPGPPPPGHVRWCLDHHPGYDPNSNLFPGPGGRLRVCRFHPRAFYGPLPPPPRPY